MPPTMTAIGLFAGIGGLEEGLLRSGAARAELLVDNWGPAQEVLRARYPDIKLEGDVAGVRSVPRVDLLAAGFPCTDLSQAGRTAGITGRASSLVRHVFRLLGPADPTWLVIENVRNMLVLDSGQAMRYLVAELEERRYRWAYRLVDSRSTGVPQRRQRVIMLASRTGNPADVLFADDAGEPPDDYYCGDAYGFYWTEGLTGLGWARDAVPTLKGGSTVGIPSPPAIWVPGAVSGRRIVLPSIEAAEALQGFDRGWTEPAELRQSGGVRQSGGSGQSGAIWRSGGVRSSNGPRWRLVGNAVTVGVSQWLGTRLVAPGEHDPSGDTVVTDGRWPAAAWGSGGTVHRVPVSMWPVRAPYVPLLSVVDHQSAKALSNRAARGFCSRMERSKLRFDGQFRADLADHVRATS
ncbi:MAG: DNA (cytosine-5-)-methyltransferase [Actinomycetota bacterium]